MKPAKPNLIKCELCQEAKEPSEAHIIPEFMYQELYDSNHFFQRIEVSNSLKIKKPLPKGIYDPTILCRDCDNDINKKSENYVSKVYYKCSGLSARELPIFEKQTNFLDEMTSNVINNLNYTKFKIFLLSVLWRSSITRREEFKEVQLGKHEETIRRMIINNDPGKIDDYPCLIINFRNDLSIASQLIGTPSKVKHDGCTSYVFFIAGFLYTYYVSKYNAPDFVYKCAINTNNEIIIPDVPKGQGEYVLRKLYGLHI